LISISEKESFQDKDELRLIKFSRKKKKYSRAIIEVPNFN